MEVGGANESFGLNSDKYINSDKISFCHIFKN